MLVRVLGNQASRSKNILEQERISLEQDALGILQAERRYIYEESSDENSVGEDLDINRKPKPTKKATKPTKPATKGKKRRQRSQSLADSI